MDHKMPIKLKKLPMLRGEIKRQQQECWQNWRQHASILQSNKFRHGFHDQLSMLTVKPS
jgi:hypothetical protein